MKKIEDYLHLYGKNVQVFVKRYDDEGFYYEDISIAHIHNSSTEYIKPVLRPLSSMTGEERLHLSSLLPASINNLIPPIKSGRHAELWINAAVPNAFLWMLSLNFDIFDLIPSGLALDATKINF